MSAIVHFDTVEQYNTAMHQPTYHPLVGVIDFSKAPAIEFPDSHSFGFYTIFLKQVHCGNIRYGRNIYDYQAGTLVFIAPGQAIKIENRSKHQPQGYALIFHPDLIIGTSLLKKINQFRFFSYQVSEALHLSEQEQNIFIECLHNIDIELRSSDDEHRNTLINSNIHLLLNYCKRFYNRQFDTRSVHNHDILTQFEALIDNYFNSGMQQTEGALTVKYCADKLNLSVNYFGDLIKRETNQSPRDHIQRKVIETAKNMILDTNKSINEISDYLGFKYPQYFSILFHKCVGMSPNKYRVNHLR